MLVPVPRFQSLKENNTGLLQTCKNDGDREHYKKEELISILHLKDKENLLELPGNIFDATTYEKVKINSYGKFTLNKGLHEYSVTPKLAGQRAMIKITAHEVSVLYEDFSTAVTHPRLYGDFKQSSMQWIPYLNQLAKKPGALKYSGIYPMMPATMQEYLSKCRKDEQKRVLQVLERITKEAGFDKALETVNEALTYESKDADSLFTVYLYINANLPALNPVEVPEDIPKLGRIASDINVYDNYLKKGGESLC